MKMKTILLLFLGAILLFTQQINAQQDTLSITLEVDKIQNLVKDAPLFENGKRKQSPSQISLPTISGKSRTFNVFETISIEEPLYSRFPKVRSYIIVGVNNDMIRGRLSTGPNYIRVMTKQNGQHEFIEPTSKKGEYKLYNGVFKKEHFTCGHNELDEHIHNEFQNRSSQSSFTNGATLRTYRIAIATTGEFYQEHGNNNTAVLAKVNGYLNLLNDIFEAELAVHFNLIGNNTAILFPDPATDGLNPANPINTSQTVINSTIGAANYDIGHTFHALAGSGMGGSGIANLGVICEDNFKAGAWTSATGSSSDALWTGLWAHEIGHQFGAHHTMYGTTDNGTTSFCAQRSPGHGYEPGSGNSLMSYEGICGSQNITPEASTFYFHNHSLEEIINEMNSKTCQVSTSTANSIPITSAPVNKTIPKGTPFELEGSSTDGDGDTVYYNWEEFDTDNIAYGPNAPEGVPANAANSTTAPLFRSFDPSSDGAHRVFPTISDIVNNIPTQGEVLPNISRNMKFRLTSRDFNLFGGGVSCAEVDITVDDTMGPFDVTSQSTATTWTANGGNVATIVWNVANTNTICANVDILFSTDRGLTFPYTLASNIANDGSHLITVPSLPTSIGRVKVKCSDNYFFDINLGDITISSTCDAVATTFSPDTDVAAILGSSALNLSLSPDFGNVISAFNGSITSTDPSSILAVELSTGGCGEFGLNVVNYDSYNFMVPSSSTYTFNNTSGTSVVINLYEGSYIAGSPCVNFIASATVSTNGSSNIGSSVSATLAPGINYVLVVSSFSASFPALPAAYNIVPQQTVYDNTPPPPSGFSYTYVAVDQGTGNIVAIDANSNFTTLAAGTYDVYGLSYETSNNINTYIGSSYSAFQMDIFNLVVCGAISLNDITLTIESTANCPTDYAGPNGLTGTESGIEDYETDGAIESTQIINGSATIDYDSGTSITLNSPFQVNLGATFNAFIDGCDGLMIQDVNSENK